MQLVRARTIECPRESTVRGSPGPAPQSSEHLCDTRTPPVTPRHLQMSAWFSTVNFSSVLSSNRRCAKLDFFHSWGGGWRLTPWLAGLTPCATALPY